VQTCSVKPESRSCTRNVKFVHNGSDKGTTAWNRGLEFRDPNTSDWQNRE